MDTLGLSHPRVRTRSDHACTRRLQDMTIEDAVHKTESHVIAGNWEEPIQLEVCLRARGIRDLAALHRSRLPSGTYSRLSRDQRQSLRDIPLHALKGDARAIWAFLFEDDHYDCYLRVSRYDRQGKPSLELAFAADSPRATNRSLVDALGGWSLVLAGELLADESRFFVHRVERVRPSRACGGALRIGVQVRLSVVFDAEPHLSSRMVRTHHSGRQPVPAGLMEWLHALPRAADYQAAVQERLEHWQHYLNVLHRLAEEKQWSVRYTGYRTGRSPAYLVFALEGKVPWQLLRNTRGDPVLVAPDDEADDYSAAGYDRAEEDSWIELGVVDRVDQRHRRVTVQLSDELLGQLDDLDDLVPRRGWLKHSAHLEQTEINRLEQGLKRFADGDARNPNLGSFLFDASLARTSAVSLEEPDTLWAVGSGRRASLLNDMQREAVERALLAPDLYLIKGPPGTGKTHVIAELCRQLVARRQRVLIASQSNLAVDNAIARLTLDGPVRAVRYGPEHRVEEEGKPFHESRVVARWLAETRESCRNFWDQVGKLVEDRERIEAVVDRMDRYIPRVRLEAEQRERVRLLHDRRTDLEEQLKAARAERDACVRQAAAIQEALEWCRDHVGRDSTASPLATRQEIPSAPTPSPLPPHVRDLVGPLVENEPAYTAYSGGVHSLYKPLPTLMGRDAFERALSGQAREADTSGAFEWFALHVGMARLAERVLDAFESARPVLDKVERYMKDYHALLAESARIEQRIQTSVREIQQGEAQRESIERALATLRRHRHVVQSWLDSLPARSGALQRWAEAAQQELTRPRGHEQALLRVLERFPIRDIVPPRCDGDHNFIRQVEARLADAVLERFKPRIGRARFLASVGNILGEFDQLTTALRARMAELEAAMNDASVPPEKVAAARSASTVGARTQGFRPSSLSATLIGWAADGPHAPVTNWRAVLDNFHRGVVEGSFLERMLNGLTGYFDRFSSRARTANRLLDGYRQYAEALACAEEHRTAALTAAEWARNELSPGVLCEELRTCLDAALRGELQSMAANLNAVQARLDETDTSLREARERLAHREAEAAIHGERLQRARDLLHTAVTDIPVDYESLRHLGECASECAATGDVSRAKGHLDRWDALRTRFNDWIRDVDVAPELNGFVHVLETILDRHAKAADSTKARVDELLAELEQVEADQQRAEQEIQRLTGDPDSDFPGWWKANGPRIVAQTWDQRVRTLFRRIDPSATLDPLLEVRNTLAELAQKRERHKSFHERFSALAREWMARLEQQETALHSDLRPLYVRHANVIATTCSQTGTQRFRDEYGTFDVVIVDEVSKATPPELLLPTLLGRRCILIGDDRQLPPMLGHNTIRELAEELGLPEGDLQHLKRSPFAELWTKARPEIKTMLHVQYRMHDDIMRVVNQFYDEKLECGLNNPDVERAHGFSTPWLSPSAHVVWLNMPPIEPCREKKDGTSYYNDGEIDVIHRVLAELNDQWRHRVAAGEPPKAVGVISFYAAQVERLRSRLLDDRGRFDALDLRVGTVDRFQGMERPVIIASMVRNNADGDIGFAKTPERINVALSRAQQLLLLVGSVPLFAYEARDPVARAIYQRVLEAVEAKGAIVDGASFLGH